MKIGFTATAEGWDAAIDPRFGRTAFLLIYDEENDCLTAIDNASMKEREHGAGPGTAKILIDNEVTHLVTGNGPGANTASLLEKANIKVFTGASELSVADAYKQFKKNMLNNF